MNDPTFLLSTRSLYQAPPPEDESILSSRLQSIAGFRNERLPPDFLVFSTSGIRDAFEPIPMAVHRAPHQQETLRSMLKQSVEFLFANPSNSQTSSISSPNPRESSVFQECKQRYESPPDTMKSPHPDDTHWKRKRADSAPSMSAQPWLEDTDGDVNNTKPPAKRGRRNSLASGSAVFRFRQFQSNRWDMRYEDLLAFREANGHCSVPYLCPQNPALARWVKRQRYQYKLYQKSKASTITEQRIQALERIGFVWDAHNAAWEERFSELRAFREDNGHCWVPIIYENKKLAAWVKRQRSEYRLHLNGRGSNITAERIGRLNQMGFHWEVRAFASMKPPVSSFLPPNCHQEQPRSVP